MKRWKTESKMDEEDGHIKKKCYVSLDQVKRTEHSEKSSWSGKITQERKILLSFRTRVSHGVKYVRPRTD